MKTILVLVTGLLYAAEAFAFTNLCESNYDVNVIYSIERQLQKNCGSISLNDLYQLKELYIIQKPIYKCTPPPDRDCHIIGQEPMVYLPTNTFNEMPNLEKLRISHLTVFTANLFKPLGSLKSLIIEQGKDTAVIAANAFEGLTNLTEMEFRGGWKYPRAIDLPDNLFINLKRLEKLEFHEFAITQFNDNTFAGLEALQTFTFSDANHATAPLVSEKAFQYFGNVKEMQLRSGYYTWDGGPTRPTVNNWIPENSLIYLRSVESLYLGADLDQSFPNLQGLDKLVDLDLGFSKMTSIRPNFFSNLPQLQTLSLYGTGLTNIDSSTFSELDNLLLLDIGYNPVTSFDPTASLSSLAKLKCFGFYSDRFDEVTRRKLYEYLGTHNIQPGTCRLIR